MSDGKYACSIKFASYVVAAVQMIKDLLSEDDREMNSGKQTHKGKLIHGYKYELDVTDKCDDDHVYLFQKLIRILLWVVDLRRIDIQIEVALL